MALSRLLIRAASIGLLAAPLMLLPGPAQAAQPTPKAGAAGQHGHCREHSCDHGSAAADWLSGTATVEDGNGADPAKYFSDWRGTPSKSGRPGRTPPMPGASTRPWRTPGRASRGR